MPPLHRCLCLAFRCNEQITADGERGVELDKRRFENHQLQERRRLIRATAKEQERIALDAQYREMEDAFTNMSLKDTTLEQARYLKDRAREMIAHIAPIIDDCATYRSRLETLGRAPDEAVVSDTAIQEALLLCSKAKLFVDQARSSLATAARGVTRKTLSVITVRQDALNAVNELLLEAQAIESTWEILWKSREEELEKLRSNGRFYDSSDHFESILKGVEPIVQLIFCMIVVCHVVLGFPRRGCTWLFDICKYILQITATVAAGVVNDRIHTILENFPRDVRTAVNNFHVEGKSTVYATCPKCHTTYAPSKVNGMDTYPERCQFSRHGKRCGEIMVRPKRMKRGTAFIPIRPYIVYDFHHWLAGLLCRTGYEEMMDKAWKKTEQAAESSGPMTDIFQGSFIRNLKGPDGKTHFSKSGDDTSGRYLFSLFCDSFNPLGNKAGGKKISLVVFAMVCLNLPIEIRYKPENMFLLSIAPGPNEITKEQINPYMRPIVDVFLKFWEGVYFKTTLLHELGRLIFCALILIVCDLPAARKVGGFAAHSHDYFCSTCWCSRTRHGLNDYNYGEWKWRTDAECREHARRFREAPGAKEEAGCFDSSGVRSSELLRLPYYSPTLSLAIDPMHNLFLGLVKEHFQNILGYRPSKKEAEIEPPPFMHITPSDANPEPESKNDRAAVRKLIRWLSEPIAFDTTGTTAYISAVMRFKGASLAALVYVCKGVGCIPNDIQPDGSQQGVRFVLRKQSLAELLLNWRLEHNEEFELEITPADALEETDLGSVFTDEEMEEIWRDIDRMIKPSWATSIPRTISSHGPKLKSDEWRAAGSLYLPVSLIRLWSKTSNEPVEEKKRKKREERQKLLHMTMLLFSAVSIITSRTATTTQADLYLKYMLAYRHELATLFPHYQCHPNHHIAMHLGEYLTLYGPVHGWWTFPFERMIGTLQRVKTNYKQGEYEKTIGAAWHRSANMKALFAKAACPKVIRNCIEYYETLVKPQNRIVLANVSPEPSEFDDNADFDEEDDDRSQPISAPLYEALKTATTANANIPPKATFRRRHTEGGMTFSVQETHEGNSGVMTADSTPFVIQHILRFDKNVDNSSIWFICKRHKKYNGGKDPYQDYPIRTKIWSVDFEDEVVAIPFRKVATHFAKCVVPWEGSDVAVIASLSRAVIA